MVLLGDGLATGFGAWVNLGSLSGLVKHLNEATPTRVGIKTEWAFFERYVRSEPSIGRVVRDLPASISITCTIDSGVLNSTTRDWLPAAAGGKGMIDRVMGSRACSDVEVAVLLVGLQDALQLRDAAALVALAVRALRGGSVCGVCVGSWGRIAQCFGRG